MSLPQVGQALGGRDHTTVMHGCEKIAALFEKDDEIRHQILEIRNKLYSNGQKVPAPQGTRRS
jgi:chromosomal replication initiator protein